MVKEIEREDKRRQRGIHGGLKGVFVVRLDPSPTNLDAFAADAERAGIGGGNRVSSEAGAKFWRSSFTRERSA